MNPHVFIFMSIFLFSSGICKKFSPDKYLMDFGYLDEKKPKTDGTPTHSAEDREQAVRFLQKMLNLPVTGVLDPKLVKMMKAGRCGVKDLTPPRDRGNAKPREPLPFYAIGSKWDKSTLTYRFVRHTRQLSQSVQRRAISKALQKWSDVTNLNFREVSGGNADIVLNYGSGNHGDSYPFDGRGGTLAHAFFPGSDDIAGDTHFDESEKWTDGTSDGTNLEIVAAHEFGHALGLSHSNVPGALMAPYYSGYDPQYKLHSDDIQGIQSLYGVKRRPPTRPTRAPVTTRRPRPTRAPVTTRRPRPTRAPVTTRRPRPTRAPVTTRRPRPTRAPVTTRRPRPTRAPVTRPPTSSPTTICRTKFDAIFNSFDRRVYAMRGSKIYKFERDVNGIESARYVRRTFPRAPKNVGAVVMDRYGRVFMFKGKRYWRYNSRGQLESGYPKVLKGKTNFFRNVQSAVTTRDGTIYLMKGDKISVWREDFTAPPRGYPVLISRIFSGVPNNVEAAIRWQGYIYFFKGYNYFKFDERYRRVSRGYPKPKAPAWLGCGRAVPK